MGKVRRKGTGHSVNNLKKRNARHCVSAPNAPSSVTLSFRRRHVDHHEFWAAKVSFSAVTTDVASRPLKPDGYQVQLVACDSGGNALEGTDVMKKLLAGDDTNWMSGRLPKPKTYYWKARVRTLNRVRDGGKLVKCWSAWSAYTSPAKASAGGAMSGPPAPTGLNLSFDKVESAKGNPWRLKARWNQNDDWTPTDGEESPIQGYDVQVGVSTSSSGSPLKNVRRGIRVGHEDGETYARYEGRNIRGRRYYRFRVRARALGRPGSWSSWTSWKSPNGLPAAPTNVTTENPVPRKIVVRWDPPSDLTDVDRYQVNIYRNPSTVNVLVRTGFVAEGTHHFNWNIPSSEYDAHPNATYKGRVYSVEAPYSTDADDDPVVLGTFDLSETSVSAADSPEITNTAQWSIGDLNLTGLAITDGTAPASSPAVTATVPNLARTVNLTWTSVANADPITYDVYRHTSAVFTPPGTGTLIGSVGDPTHTAGTTMAVSDSGVAEGTTYYYRLIARDADGSAAPGTASAGVVPRSRVTDSNPPSSSPTPEVFGGVGYLAVSWEPVDNIDPVTYEVHVSASSGFTPGATTTKVGEVTGTMFFVRTLRGGAPLSYLTPAGDPVPYYVKLIAKDEDGAAAASAEASAALTQVNTGDLAVNTVTADQIYAASFSTQNLGAVNSLISRLVAGDESGQHVAIDDAGLRVYDSAGGLLVDLPTDPERRPIFNGDLIAQSLQVIGATFLGQTTIAAGTNVTLSTGVDTPASGPGVSITYPASGSEFRASGTLVTDQWFTLAYTATGGAGGATPSFYTARPSGSGYWRYIDEFRASDGERQRTITLPDATDDVWGVAAIGTNLYVLHQRSSVFYLRKYALADLSNPATATVTTYCTSAAPSLGTDGTSLYILSGASASSSVSIRWAKFNTLLVLVTNQTQSVLLVDGRSGNYLTEFAGPVYFGGKWYVSFYTYSSSALYRRYVYAFTGSPDVLNNLVRASDDDFPGQAGAETDGITTDGTYLYSILDGRNLVRHTSWTWTSATSSTLQVGYSWYDSNAAGTGTHETKVSPSSSIAMRKRAAITVSTPGLPGSGGTDDPDKRRIYAKHSSTAPAAGAWWRQTETTSTTALVTSYATSSADPTTNTFPLTGAASITPYATNVSPLYATGEGFMPVGLIAPYVGSTAPTGWLICNGATVSRTTYARLNAVLAASSYPFGAGDGSTTFTLPDLRSRAPYGAGTFVSLGGNDGLVGTANEIYRDLGHAHGSGSYSTGSAGGHNHDSHNLQTNTRADAGANRLTGPTNHSTDGGHSHSVSGTSSWGTPSAYLGVTYIVKT